MKTFGLIFYTVLRVSLVFLFLFLVVDLIKPGFIVHFSYMVYYILISFSLSILTLIYYRPLHKIFSRKKVLFNLMVHFIIALIISFIVLNLLTIENDNALLLSITSGVVYYISILLYLNRQRTFLEF